MSISDLLSQIWTRTGEIIKLQFPRHREKTSRVIYQPISRFPNVEKLTFASSKGVQNCPRLVEASHKCGIAELPEWIEPICFPWYSAIVQSGPAPFPLNFPTEFPLVAQQSNWSLARTHTEWTALINSEFAIVHHWGRVFCVNSNLSTDDIIPTPKFSRMKKLRLYTCTSSIAQYVPILPAPRTTITNVRLCLCLYSTRHNLSGFTESVQNLRATIIWQGHDYVRGLCDTLDIGSCWPSFKPPQAGGAECWGEGCVFALYVCVCVFIAVERALLLPCLSIRETTALQLSSQLWNVSPSQYRSLRSQNIALTSRYREERDEDIEMASSTRLVHSLSVSISPSSISLISGVFGCHKTSIQMTVICRNGQLPWHGWWAVNGA